MNCCCSAGFGLHFNNLYSVAEQVFTTLSCPFIHMFWHWRRWCDWVNSCHFRETIRYVCCSLVAVHSFHFTHVKIASLKQIKINTCSYIQNRGMYIDSYPSTRRISLPLLSIKLFLKYESFISKKIAYVAKM